VGGFWEKSQRARTEFIPRPLININVKWHNLKCFPVDHSILGACAWGLETESGWVVYSGDLRLHGKRSYLTQKFISDAAALKPAALIIEGTNIERHKNVGEQEVYEKGLAAISKAKGLVIADFSARDIDRLLTFLQIAHHTNRKLAITAKDAYLIRTLKLVQSDIPDIQKDNHLYIYQETAARADIWQRNIFKDYDDKTVLAKDIHAAQDEFILCFSFFDVNELPGIAPSPGGLYLFSTSEAHSEEQKMDIRRLHHWLDKFNFQKLGVPLEINNDIHIPEGEEGLHASGHACGTDLLQIAREIRPQVLIPVHCEKPQHYVEGLRGSGIEVRLPSNGGTIDL